MFLLIKQLKSSEINDGNQTGFGAVQMVRLSNKPLIGGNDILIIG
jgi:hypothetical protein